jgi:hypothetical protein
LHCSSALGIYLRQHRAISLATYGVSYIVLSLHKSFEDVNIELVLRSAGSRPKN